MNQKSGATRSLGVKGFTDKQGQYLAFIYTYSHMFRRPPAETDMQRHFQVSPPSVHQYRDARTKWPHSPSTWRPPKYPNPRCSERPANLKLARNQPVRTTVTS